MDSAVQPPPPTSHQRPANAGTLGSPPHDATPAQLAMYIGIGSMTMLFGASLVAYFVTRAQAKAWRAVDLPTMPWGLWISTGILLALSLCLRAAVQAIRGNRFSALSRQLFTALLLGISFCAAQVDNWRHVLRGALSVEVKGLYVYTFFMLTGLHFLHVLVGLVPLWVVHRRSVERLYSSSRFEGVRLVRQYWDFLFVVWVVLFLALGLS